MPIVGFCGPANVGKSTSAHAFKDVLHQRGHSAVVLSWADPLYDCASVLTGIPVEKLRSQEFKEKPMGSFADVPDIFRDKSPREFLQWFGTDVMRNQLVPTFWVEHGLSRARRCAEKFILFDDCRFATEFRVVDFVIELHRPRISYACTHEASMPPDRCDVHMSFDIGDSGPAEVGARLAMALLGRFG